MKNSRRHRHWSAFVLLATLLAIGRADGQGGSTDKQGTLVVLVTWDDAYKTPATGVYVEAHGCAVNGVLEKSFVLKMAKAGRYEGPLPPGVYDVFVSEASSTPRCRRVLINPEGGQLWNLMLEHDDVYLQR